MLEPGSAIDCCGHDILVVDQEVFDFTQAPAVKALIQANDTATHELEFCLVWRECPTEEVPILYDECGCSDSQCAPNRILESYALEVRVDPPKPPANLGSPRFDWGPSIGIADATAVALDETGQRVFVAAGTGSNSTVYQVGTQHLLTELSFVVGQTILDLALSPDGKTLYAAVAAAASGPAELMLLTPDNGSGITAGAKAPLGSSTNDTTVALSVAPDGRLLAVGTSTGDLWLFAAGFSDPTTPAAIGTVTTPCSAAAFSSDGQTAWLGQSGHPSVFQVNLATMASTPQPIAVGSADIVALVATGSGPDHLAVLNHTASSLYLVDPNAATVVGPVQLSDPPVAVLVAQGGGSAIVESAKALQAVNLMALANGAANPVGADFVLQPTIGRSALTVSGRRLFVPFTGAGPAPAGGVAVVDLSDTDCGDALLGHDCPDCDTPDCLVLATVSGWQVGFTLQDTLDPPSDPAADTTAKIARIDNDARTVLASTQAITRALRCLIEQCCGAATPPAPIAPVTPVVTPLTHITQISWPHRGEVVFSNRFPATLAMAFDRPVNSLDLTQPSALMVLVSYYETIDNTNFVLCWCQVPMVVAFASASTNPPGQIPTTGWAPLTNPQTFCTAVQMTLDAGTVSATTNFTHFDKSRPSLMRVILNGDLVRDESGTALDANHLPPWLPAQPTGDGIAGGTFESWFSTSYLVFVEGKLADEEQPVAQGSTENTVTLEHAEASQPGAAVEPAGSVQQHEPT